jgi:ABC-type transport system involved in multi-copper enzyme maturation permease subunit
MTLQKDQKNISSLSTLLAHISVEIDLEKKKIVILTILFVFMGLMAVATQVMLPEILKLAGIEIANLPEPSFLAVFADFWGDSGFFALIIVLLTMGTFSSEIDVNKQAYITLSRPISRTTYFLTRTIIKTIGLFIVFFVASLVTFLYTLAFYESIYILDFLVSAILISISFCSTVVIVSMFSAKFSTIISGILGFFFLFSQLFIILIEPIQWIVPFGASAIWIDIFIGLEVETSDLLLSLGSLTLWIIGPLLIGWYFYNNRDL